MIRTIARSAFTRYYFRNLNSSVMCADKLTEVPDVEIDPDGVFKYVLIKVYGHQTDEGEEEPHKLIVRGNKRGSYHADIYDETMEKIKELGLDSECLGGGRISHISKEKKINVYGYSQGFGRADHNTTKEILLKKYPDYEVCWSNEGY